MENKVKKTKVLAIGDIHGDIRLVEKLAERAVKENIDVVILAGDLTLAESSIEGIIGPFAKAKKTVLIVPGNHEAISTTSFLSEVYAPYSKHLHGYSFVKTDVGFFGAGTANMGIHRISDSEIFKLLKKSHDEIKDIDKKIMVTHIHPAGSKSEFSGWPGSEAVRKAIEKFQPDIAICAHIEEGSGLEEMMGKTHVINVARKPTVFEL
ncbi:MAG TPA: metallophosphoesterase [Candidatus Nanoarchaeia archaeon]|nr:metallophosphoesterase [Candidatus Nanoarchaeia archaeon]